MFSIAVWKRPFWTASSSSRWRSLSFCSLMRASERRLSLMSSKVTTDPPPASGR